MSEVMENEIENINIIKNKYKGIYDIDEFIRVIFSDLDEVNIQDSKKVIKLYFKGKKNDENLEKPFLYKGQKVFIFDEDMFVSLMNESLEQFIYDNIGFKDFDKIKIAIKCYPLGIDTTRILEKPEFINADEPKKEKLSELEILKQELLEYKNKLKEKNPFDDLKKMIELQQLMQPQKINTSDDMYRLLKIEQDKNDRLEKRIREINLDNEERLDRYEKKFKNEVKELKEEHSDELKKLKNEYQKIIDDFQEDINDADSTIEKLKKQVDGNAITNTVDKILEYIPKPSMIPTPTPKAEVNTNQVAEIPKEKLQMLIQKYSGTLSVIKMMYDEKSENEFVKTELLKSGGPEVQDIIKHKNFIIDVLPRCNSFLKEIGFNDHQLIQLKNLIQII